MKLILAYPPSANHYKGKNGNREYLKPEAKQYHQLIKWQVLDQVNNSNFGDSILKMQVIATAPDKRKRDVTNLEKVLKDSLERCGLYDNDVQIWDFSIKWDYYGDDKDKLKKIIDPDKTGWVEVEINKIGV